MKRVLLSLPVLIVFGWVGLPLYSIAQTNFSQERWVGAWGSDGPIETGDLNADGKTDVFMWRNSTHSWTVNLSTGTGFQQQEWQGAWGSDGPIEVGDLNGDGRTDVFMWRNSTHSWTVNLSTGTGFQQQEWQGAWGSDGPIEVGDLNGDGKADVFMWRNSTHSWTVNISTGTGFQQEEWKGAWGSDGPIEVGDLNGDGKTDVFMWRNSTHSWTVNISTGTGFQQEEWKGAWGSDGPIEVGDLNGDGKTDVFMWRNSTHSWTVNLSTGTGFQQLEWQGAWGSDGPIEVGDLNADGKTDVFMWRNSSHSWTVNLSTGTGFQQQEWQGAWGSDGPILVGDLNGDGSSDVWMWRDSDKSWTVNLSPLNDLDKDGLNDNKEHEFLEKFRPYYKFSADDDNKVDEFAPADALSYITSSEIKNGEYDGKDQFLDHPPATLIKNSDLDNNLNLLLNATSNILLNQQLSNYCINPLGHAIYGVDWNTISQAKNTGMYGHVVPLMLPSQLLGEDAVDIFTADITKYPAADLRKYYKVEYWQFYGFNRDSKEGCVPLVVETLSPVGKPLIITSASPALAECVADHEADWCTVQLLIDHNERIVKVYHFAHGKMMRFDMTKVTAPPSFSGPDNSFAEWHGTKYNLNVTLSSVDSIINNLVQLYKEPGRGDFTHPVAYIEYEGHEVWPSTNWDFKGPHNTSVYAHNGQGLYQYLTSTPPNLGEVEFPLTEYKRADLLMRFNGRWGTYNWDNDPPQGPPLHTQWNWPQSSSIRWLIPAKSLTY